MKTNVQRSSEIIIIMDKIYASGIVHNTQDC